MRTKLIFLFLCIALAAVGQSANVALPEDLADRGVSQEEQSRIFQAHVAITYHRVNKGEDLNTIARSNDVSAENIRIWNNLESDHISAGTQLEIRKIEFIPVEKIQLAEPELKTIEVDRAKTIEVMADYVGEINSVTSVLPGWVETYEQIILLSEQNFENNTRVDRKPFWNHISDAANIAFNSVKDWSKSIINKQDVINTEILLADNKQPYTAPVAKANIVDPVISEKKTKKVSETEIVYNQAPEKKKNVWHHMSDATITTFNSVKGWTKSLFNKQNDNTETGSGVFLAKNTELILNLDTGAGIGTEQPAAKIPNLKKEQASFPKGDNWKRIYHKVRIGETMVQIATRYNVSKNDIVQWNNLPSDIANVKQRLLIFVPKSFTLAHN